MAYLGNAPARSFISFERQVFTIVNSQTAYTLDNLRTDIRNYTEVASNVLSDTVLERIIKKRRIKNS